MDFMHRTPQNQPQTTRPAPAAESVTLPSSSGKNGKKQESDKDLIVIGSRIGANVLLFIVSLLVAAVVWLIYSSTPASQAKYVDTTKLQAVFLNSGQVYFGNLQTLNKDYFVLSNVFYLQTNNQSGQTPTSSTSPNSQVSLVKLGCELHMPYDRMVINSAQVTFWENLQDNGQVAKAASQFDKQNPNGQKCTDQSQAPNPANNVQGNSSANTSTTNTTTKH
jgi:hypothetical protein